MILRNRASIIVLGLTVATGWAAAQDPPQLLPQADVATSRCPQERERLADLLFSDDLEQVEVVATSYDAAMELIYLAIDEFLVSVQLECPAAAELGGAGLRGLDRHKVTATTRTLIGSQHVVVSGAAEATALGDLLAETAGILASACSGPQGPEPQAAATNLFSHFVFDSDNGVPMVHQYLEQAQKVAAMPRDQQLGYLR